ncbi:Eco57I restriction-modification methylase domain-containing protein [Rufibacter ruber]|uniref:Eco57I restriction-modification methylase domain-containing protein n=1 Tax=Rufibacter ruber TaxID=1783499 RepID=UPI00082CE05A|nr:N-6 DNA methylase [Rufibacter ruber]
MAELYTPIFSKKYLETKTRHFQLSQYPDLTHKLDLILKWQAGIKSGKIVKQKEEELQSEFLNTFFGEVLEYVYSPEAPKWNLSKEHKSGTDSTKADGALGYFWLFGKERKADVRAVIELKDARADLDKPQNRLNDKRSPIEQAFSYVPKAGGNCKWVLVSNFLEIRLYHHADQSRYERFDVLRLHEEKELLRFLFLLHKDRLLLEHGEAATEQLFRERQAEEQNITKHFYKDYKTSRLDLFQHLRSQNPDVPELVIFQKTQKLLDRVVFVCFCEDLTIIPPYTFRGLLKTVKEDRFNRQDTKIYERVKGLFMAIDEGYPDAGINKFNGGLFAPDTVLDNLQIKDSTLEHIIALEKYDFASDLNVNILGHIFEQSISDIEEIKAEIAGEAFDVKKGKRKKDGVFYTPEYITRYIVKEAVGGWLQDRQQELGFAQLPELTEADYASIRFDARKKLVTNKAVEKHLTAWTAYRDVLQGVKVLDPACGSGAFLNQVFDFLFQEGQRVNKEVARLRGGQFEAFDLDRHILTNNIFGVDLNEESVEITKLSLWLKTANKSKELTTLDANIKCGNSLIADPAVAGDKAFDWPTEFPEVFASGGFDVVVGNPPYVDIKALSKDIVNYLFKAFETAENRINLYSIFIEQGLKVLGKNGHISFVIPNSLLINSSYKKIRNLLVDGLARIVKLPDGVFEEAQVETIIFQAAKERKIKSVKIISYLSKENILNIDNTLERDESKEAWIKDADKNFSIYSSTNEQQVLSKCELGSVLLEDIAEFALGITPYDKYKGHSEELIKSRTFHSEQKLDDSYKPLIGGENITRFYIQSTIKEYIKYGSWLGAPREEKFFTSPRIIIRQIVSGNPPRIYAGYTEEPLYFTQIGFAIIPNRNDVLPKYLLSLLNSSLITYYHKYRFLDIHKDLFQKILIANCKRFPIKLISPEAQQPFIDRADRMLQKNQELQALSQKFLTLLQSELGVGKLSQKLEKWYTLTWDDFAKELVKAKIKLTLAQKSEWLSFFTQQHQAANQLVDQLRTTDKEIDLLVYQLYGLTPEEIKLVEGD